LGFWEVSWKFGGMNRAYLEKIDLDVKSEGKKKLYNVPEDTRKEVFG